MMVVTLRREQKRPSELASDQLEIIKNREVFLGCTFGQLGNRNVGQILGPLLVANVVTHVTPNGVAADAKLCGDVV